MRHLSTEDTKQQNVSGVIFYLSSFKHIFVAFLLQILHIFPTGDGAGLQAGLYNVVFFVLLKSA